MLRVVTILIVMLRIGFASECQHKLLRVDFKSRQLISVETDSGTSEKTLPSREEISSFHQSFIKKKQIMAVGMSLSYYGLVEVFKEKEIPFLNHLAFGVHKAAFWRPVWHYQRNQELSEHYAMPLGSLKYIAPVRGLKPFFTKVFVVLKPEVLASIDWEVQHSPRYNGNAKTFPDHPVASHLENLGELYDSLADSRNVVRFQDSIPLSFIEKVWVHPSQKMHVLKLFKEAIVHGGITGIGLGELDRLIEARSHVPGF